MADRTVSVSLKADVAAYIASMTAAGAATERLAAQAAAASAAGSKMTSGLSGTGRAADAMTASAGKAGTAAATMGAGLSTVGQKASTAEAGMAKAGTAAGALESGLARTGTGAAAAGAGMASAGKSATTLESGLTRTGAGATAAASGMSKAGTGASSLAAGAGKASTAAAGAASSATKAATATESFGSHMSKASNSALSMSTSMAASAVGFAGMAAAIATPVKASMDLEAAMSKVKATGAVTSSQMASLKTSAMSMATSFGVSGTQAMGAVEALIKAGVSAKDVMSGGLTGALSLAAAGEMDVGEAAETASSAMTMFGLKGKDVGHVADDLSQGANMAQGSVKDLSMALSQGGTVAASMGMNLDQTVGGLAEFANAGIKGSDAGTSLKTMLQQIANPTKQSSKLMAKLGLDFFDAQGKFVGLAGVAGQLQSRLGGLTQQQRTQAMAQIFGSDAMRVANVLYKDGADKANQWATGVSKAGAAQATASANMGNLAGDLQKMKAAWTNTFAAMGESSQSPLRSVVRYLTKLAGVVERNQQTVVTIAKIGAALAGLAVAGSAVGKAVSGVRAISSALGAISGVARGTSAVSGLGSAIANVGTRAAGSSAMAGRFAASITPAALGIAGAIVGLGALAVAWGAVHDSQHADDMTKQLGTAKQWAGDMSAGMMDLNGTMQKVNDGGFGPLRQNLAGLGDALSHATGVGLNGFEKALDGLGDKIGDKASLGAQARTEMGKVDSALSLLAQSHNWASISANWQQIADDAKAQNIPVSTLMTLFPQVQKSLGGVAQQLGVTGLSAKDYAEWMGGRLPEAVNRAALANSVLAKSLGIIPTQTKKEVSVEVKGGSKKQIDELNKEILKVPANKQAQVALTAKTKGFAPAMAEAKAFEKQAAGLQAVTSKGITFEVKNGLKGQAASLAAQVKGFSKGAQAEVAVTAKTKGFDAAAAQVRQLKTQMTGAKLNVTGDIYISVHGATQKEVNALRDDISSLPRSTQVSIAATANTKGLDAARAQLNQYLAATQGQHTVSMTMSVVDHGAVKIINDVQVATRNINGVEVKIPVSDPGAVGALTALNGVNYRVESLGGAKVLVPTSAPGAALAGQQLQMVTGKWYAINGKQIAIATSAPGAVGTKAQIDGVTGSWQRINGKVVFVATKAPGATTAKSQVDQLNSAASKTNGKHIQITATADTSQARSKINGLTGVQGHATIIVDTITGSTPRSLTSHIASKNANGNLYERHDAQIARAGSWRVWAEPETGGEAYIPLAASKRGRSRMIAAATVQKLGGDVSWFANGSSLTGAQARGVQARIVITADATASLRSTSNAAASALRNLQTVTRQTAPSLKSTNAAYANYAKANARANQLRDQKARYDAAMNVQISKASKARAKALRTTKARTDARYAQQITAARQRADALKKIYSTRAKASKAASDKLKAAQQKVTDANKAAADAQKELADSAAQAGKSLSDSFRGGGSVTDWVSSMSEGVAILSSFNSRLQQLRKLGLSQANVDTLTGMGAAQGAEMAAEILKGGKNSVAALNKASNSLDAIAKKLGLSTVARYANGGLVASQATISARAMFAEAGPESFIPLATAKRSRAIPIWWETGRRLGITTHANGSISPRGSSPVGTVSVAAPVVQIDRLVLDVPGVGTAIDARVKAIQTSTARNITRGSR